MISSHNNLTKYITINKKYTKKIYQKQNMQQTSHFIQKNNVYTIISFYDLEKKIHKTIEIKFFKSF